MVTYEIPCRKGGYLARLDGEDPKYGLRRDFISGTYIKTRRAWQVAIGAGWYEHREYYRGPCRYLAVTDMTVEELPETAAGYMDKASAGPLPGQPGYWFGPWCHCGQPVESYDADGWPRCNEHTV